MHIELQAHLSVEVLSRKREGQRFLHARIFVHKANFEDEVFVMPPFKEWKLQADYYKADAALGLLFQGDAGAQKEGANPAMASPHEVPYFVPVLPLVPHTLPEQFRRFVEERTGCWYDKLPLTKIVAWALTLCEDESREGKPLNVRVDDAYSRIPWEAVFCRPAKGNALSQPPSNLILYRHSVVSSGDPDGMPKSPHCSLAAHACVIYGVTDSSNQGSDDLAQWAGCVRQPSSDASYYGADDGCKHYPGAYIGLLPRGRESWADLHESLHGHGVGLVLAPISREGHIQLDRNTLDPKDDALPESSGIPLALGVFPYTASPEQVSAPLKQDWALACKIVGSPVGASPYCAPQEQETAALGHCFAAGVMQAIEHNKGADYVLSICAHTRNHARQIGAHSFNLVVAFVDSPFRRVRELAGWEETDAMGKGIVARIQDELDRFAPTESGNAVPIQLSLSAEESTYLWDVVRQASALNQLGIVSGASRVAVGQARFWRELIQLIEEGRHSSGLDR